jgi:hypothetical protein
MRGTFTHQLRALPWYYVYPMSCSWGVFGLGMQREGAEGISGQAEIKRITSLGISVPGLTQGSKHNFPYVF